MQHAQVDGGACVTYVGPGGAGNFVKMIHNGIEYGDMQLISEAYDILKNIGGFSNDELAETFNEWNGQELQSFLIEITALVRTLPQIILSAQCRADDPYNDATVGEGEDIQPTDAAATALLPNRFSRRRTT
jgi:6-phosphogluconate dehydrogenase (decarboxylating)